MKLRVRLARRLALSKGARGRYWGYALLAYLNAHRVDGFTTTPRPIEPPADRPDTSTP